MYKNLSIGFSLNIYYEFFQVKVLFIYCKKVVKTTFNDFFRLNGKFWLFMFSHLARHALTWIVLTAKHNNNTKKTRSISFLLFFHDLNFLLTYFLLEKKTGTGRFGRKWEGTTVNWTRFQYIYYIFRFFIWQQFVSSQYKRIHRFSKKY